MPYREVLTRSRRPPSAKKRKEIKSYPIVHLYYPLNEKLTICGLEVAGLLEPNRIASVNEQTPNLCVACKQIQEIVHAKNRDEVQHSRGESSIQREGEGRAGASQGKRRKARAAPAKR